PISRIRMSKAIAATAPITSDDAARIPQPKAAATAVASRDARGACSRRLVRGQRSRAEWLTSESDEQTVAAGGVPGLVGEVQNARRGRGTPARAVGLLSLTGRDEARL